MIQAAYIHIPFCVPVSAEEAEGAYVFSRHGYFSRRGKLRGHTIIWILY